MESAVLAPILSDSNPWYIPGLNRRIDLLLFVR